MTFQELDYSVPTRRRRFIAWAVFTVLGLGSTSGAIEAAPFRSEKSLAAAFDIFSFPGQSPVCQRRPLRFSPPHVSDRRKYKHFDNVLLIVFFSHPRYDTNLDFYSEVYSEYFSNVSYAPSHNYTGRFGIFIVVVYPLLFADIIHWSCNPRRFWLRSFLRCTCRHVSNHGRSGRPRRLQDRRANGAPYALHCVARAPVLRWLSLGTLRHAPERTAPSAVRPEQILVPLAIRPIYS